MTEIIASIIIAWPLWMIASEINQQEMKEKIVSKVNEGQESEVPQYTWDTIPESLKQFWYNQLKK